MLLTAHSPRRIRRRPMKPSVPGKSEVERGRSSRRHFLPWAILLFACSLSVTAQEPVPIGGHVLILDNERVLEGAVERQGELYIIRGTVGEVKVPVAKALTVCTTLQDAFKFLSDRANLRDPDERLRLARWCNSHGLHEQAIAEAQASLQLRLGHLDTIQLLAMLQRPAAPASPPPPAAQTAPSIDPEPLEITSDCRALFATKVQPILMNACASCHATGKGGAFVLSRPSDLAGQAALQANLRAAVAQISFDRPTTSPLLRKACSAHGGAAKAPWPISRHRRFRPWSLGSSCWWPTIRT